MKRFTTRVLLQSLTSAVLGLVIGYFVGSWLPKTLAAELLQTVAGLTAISGSLLGWSAGWLDRSRSLIKEIDYDSAVDLFNQIGLAQREIIWRWIITLVFSMSALVFATVVKSEDIPEAAFSWLFASAVALLFVALFSVLCLFATMLSASRLKSRLEEHEHEELRKLRNQPD